MTTSDKFKQCPNCMAIWETREAFLEDSAIELVGYQANLSDLKLGVFLFNHECMSTIGIRAEFFVDLYDGPVFSERAYGSEDCRGYCLHRSELRPCPAKCDCAYVREVLQAVKKWPKK